MFRAIYDSPWHNPALFFLVAAAVLVVVARRLAFLSAWLVLFAVEIALDAYLTGGWSPLLQRHAALIGLVAVPFVILGDMRFFLLVARYGAAGPRAAPGASPGARAYAAAVAWSFLVPVTAFGTSKVLPRYFAGEIGGRRLFLLYETLFIAVALAWRFAILPRWLARDRAPTGAGAALPRVTDGVRRWLLAVASFELGMYAAWALADVIILAGADVGFGVRLVPNVMYYAAFLPFVYWTAPREVRA
jgi:hypothetical protein